MVSTLALGMYIMYSVYIFVIVCYLFGLSSDYLLHKLTLKAEKRMS